MKASKNELEKTIDNEEMAIYGGVWGDMQVVYHVSKTRFDATPLLKGLPDERDPFPHWGIITKGR